MPGLGKPSAALLGALILALVGVRADVPTRGLLHWWPDPAEGTDQVTGRRGVQRGFGPLPGSENRFGSAAGWVELGPGITNQTFTLTCWLRPGVQTYPSTRAIVSQDSGLGDGWSLHDSIEGGGAEFANHSFGETPRTFLRWSFTDGWQAVAVRVSPEFVQAWSNGVPVKELHMNLHLSAEPGLLCVGNAATGQTPWEGDLRDLRLYDRLLTDSEIQEIARTPRSAATATWPGAIVAGVNQTKITPARPADYQRQSFGTDKGLPSAEVQTIAQASDGALFLGFEVGLVRYDGWRFPVVADAASPEFAVTGPDVGAMAFAPSGDLWLGQFHGVVRRGRASWQTYPNLSDARFIRCVLPAEDGTVWLAALRDILPRGTFRLQRFEANSGRLLLDQAILGHVRDLRPAPDGLWIATKDPAAIWHYHTNLNKLTLAVLVSAQGAVKPSSHPAEPCVRVAESATQRGVVVEVWKEESGTLQWVEVRLNDLQTLHWSRDSGLAWNFGEVSTDAAVPGWVGTDHDLLKREGDRWEKLELGGPDVPVTFLCANAEGGVWAATDGAGLWLVQPTLVRMLTEEDGLDDQDVFSVSKLRNGNVLLAGWSGRCAEVNPESRSISFPDPFPHGGVFVTEHPNGTIFQVPGTTDYFIGKRDGQNIQYILSSGGTKSEALGGVSQIHAARDGNLWITASKGVYQVGELHPPPAVPAARHQYLMRGSDYSVWLTDLPETAPLMGVAEHPDDGAIWVGTFGQGLYRIHQSAVQHFPDPHSRRDNPCVPLGFSPDGTLWLGSEAGLGAFRDGTFHWVRPEAGLPESVVSDAEELDGHVRFTGRKGIHGVRRAELDDYFAGRTHRIRAFSLGLSDGLTSAETRYRVQPVMAKTDTGELWIATDGGVASFKPSEVLKALRPPPVAIEAVVANRRTIAINPDHQPILKPGEGNVVEFQFSSLSFRSPERTTFHYRLTGPGTDIGEATTQGHVHLMNLKPGRHRFTVAARSSQGFTSDPPAALEFILQPHFYETPLFQGSAAIAGVSLIGVWFTRRIRRVRRVAALEHEQRLSAERQRIARDMHDDLGATLTRLAWQAGKLEATQSASDSVGIAASVKNVLRSLDETVWAVNPVKDRLDSVVNYLGSWVRHHFGETSIKLALNLPPDVPELPVSAEWRHHVFLMVKEACGNVLKHASATEVCFDLTLSQPAGPLGIVLRDNGTGFDLLSSAHHSSADAPTKLGGNGLGNLRRRAAELGAELSIESAPGQGTTIKIVVPIPAPARP